MKNVFTLFLFITLGYAANAQRTPANIAQKEPIKSTAAEPLANFYGKKLFVASYKVDGVSEDFPRDDYVIFNEDETLNHYAMADDEMEMSEGYWSYNEKNLKLTVDYNGENKQHFTIKEIQNTKLKLAIDDEVLLLYVKKKRKEETMPTEVRPVED